ncbi:MAG: AEC family transporter [Lachnospiraceae bacterium]|nr:AEC family transporter [Lachnospiraceae bacterium]MEE3461247.1 AEC family transporter [Lachnospiraceae bacterium]
MLQSFIFSLDATLPVFLMIVIGGLLRKWGFFDRKFANTANKLVFKICLPCLLFEDLSKTDIKAAAQSGGFIGFCFAATLISILVIWAAAKIFIKDKASVGAFVQGSYRSSAAILGIAFIQNMYDNAGMAPLMIIGAVPLYNIFAVIVLSFESKDPGDAGLERKEKIRKAFINVLKNPIIIGIVLGLIASYFRMPQGKIFEKTVSGLGNISAPLALMAIGAAFEGKEAIKKIRLTCIASFIKLLGLAAVFIPIAVHLGFRNEYLIAIAIMLGSPNTPTSYVMAKEMHNDSVLASSIVVMTTLLSSVTLTFWIFLLKHSGLI